MSEWINLAPHNEIPTNSRKVFLIENILILVFNIDNEYYAIENMCTHASLPLDGGELDGDILTCPFHGAQFCIKTGAVKAPPAFEDLPTYPIRQLGEMLQIYL